MQLKHIRSAGSSLKRHTFWKNSTYKTSSYPFLFILMFQIWRTWNAAPFIWSSHKKDVANQYGENISRCFRNLYCSNFKLVWFNTGATWQTHSVSISNTHRHTYTLKHLEESGVNTVLNKMRSDLWIIRTLSVELINTEHMMLFCFSVHCCFKVVCWNWR